MADQRLRIGLIGAGGNMRLRHIPGLRALPDVEIAAVCNRRPESTGAVAQEFGIPRTFEHWQDLVADPDVDAIVIGTWPYLHCPITLAALEAGKHVLTEARMSLNALEAHRMLDAVDTGVLDGAVVGVGRLTEMGAEGSTWIEKYVIYGGLNIIGYSNHLGARILRRLQSGLVHHYATILVAGFVILVNLILLFLWLGSGS